MAELEVCRNLSLEKGKWSVLPFCLGYFGLLFPVSLPRGHKYTGVVHTFLWVPADLYAAEIDA